MQIIRTFLGFIGGALVAALGLQYYRTGTVDFPALVQSLLPFVAGLLSGFWSSYWCPSSGAGENEAGPMAFRG